MEAASLHVRTYATMLRKQSNRCFSSLASVKSFSLPREVRLQLRAEAFNAFNWRLYNNPVLNVTAPDFGRIQSVASTRTGQIGLRLTF
jgi:hypothetical protein